jgi:S1-C subfamily serine protease
MRKNILLATLSLLLMSSPTGWSQVPANLSSKILPPFVTLNIQRTNGNLASGTAFLAVKDGMLVTALHVLKDAAKVTATFPDGEVFDCAGIVDKDERHNVALIRIKAFGKPLLKINPTELAVGEKLSIPVVKDGAFGVIETSVSEVFVKGGVKFYRLAGEIPTGNNGSPLINSAGEVTGIHVTTVQNDKDVEMALPAAYLLSLESSLPVQPWTQTAPQSSPSSSPAAAANAREDAGLAAALVEIRNIWTTYSPLSDLIYRITRYGSLGHLDLYAVQSEVDNAITQASWLKTEDPLRQKLLQTSIQILDKEKQALGYDINCANLNKNAHPSEAMPQAEESARMASALFRSIPGLLIALKPDFRQLAQNSPEFLKALPVEMQYFLGIVDRKSKFKLGICTPLNNLFFIQSFNGLQLANKFGLRPGDTIVSTGGRTWKADDDIENLKVVIQENSGRELEIVINRSGKPKSLSMKIPADLLTTYAGAPDDFRCP